MLCWAAYYCLHTQHVSSPLTRTRAGQQSLLCRLRAAEEPCENMTDGCPPTWPLCQENDAQSVKNVTQSFPGSSVGAVGKWEAASWLCGPLLDKHLWREPAGGIAINPSVHPPCVCNKSTHYVCVVCMSHSRGNVFVDRIRSCELIWKSEWRQVLWRCLERQISWRLPDTQLSSRYWKIKVHVLQFQLN